MSAESIRAINYGCLPDLSDMYKDLRETGRVWACHSKPDQPCAGFLLDAVRRGVTLDFSNPLRTERG